MKNNKILWAFIALMASGAGNAYAQDTLWVRYDNRFLANKKMALKDVDSISVNNTKARFYKGSVYDDHNLSDLLPIESASMMFTDPGRYLLKPNTYSSTDYTKTSATTGYNFAHSVESDHYAVFWDVRYGSNPKYIKHPDNGSVANAYDVLAIGERCWDMYCKLGFMKPGHSTTDYYKIQLYIPYQSEWRADASGTDGVSGGKTGIGHFNPWAATARGGHTVAHEIGHTFQYLVSADLGMDHGFNYGYGENASGGNGWWESCADWQAYKIFPDRQFTDGEYYEQYVAQHYLNLMHEDWRYANCFIQDWWCQKHGVDFIGRLWRESNKPEDPIEAYKRLCNLTQSQFCDEQMQGYMHMATWDIDSVRERAKHRIGSEKDYLVQLSANTWQSDADHCIQNYGYDIINMKVPAAETVVRASFKGIAGTGNWRKVNVDKAGWRYAFVAYNSSTGKSTYGDVGSAKEGNVELTVPQGTTNLFFVVMGAPTEHWRHAWDDNKSNDEQWPYQVTFTATTPK